MYDYFFHGEGLYGIFFLCYYTELLLMALFIYAVLQFKKKLVVDLH